MGSYTKYPFWKFWVSIMLNSILKSNKISLFFFITNLFLRLRLKVSNISSSTMEYKIRLSEVNWLNGEVEQEQFIWPSIGCGMGPKLEPGKFWKKLGFSIYTCLKFLTECGKDSQLKNFEKIWFFMFSKIFRLDVVESLDLQLINFKQSWFFSYIFQNFPIGYGRQKP